MMLPPNSVLCSCGAVISMGEYDTHWDGRDHGMVSCRGPEVAYEDDSNREWGDVGYCTHTGLTCDRD